METTTQFGKEGEDDACKYLVQKGYMILERNYHYGRNEIDIIARHDGEVVFVEVKTRSTDFFSPPERAVNTAKQKAIIRVANSYIQQHNIDLEARFDIVAIVKEENEIKINHIENAFWALPF